MSQIVTYLGDARVHITARMPLLKKTSIARRKTTGTASHEFENYTLGATYMEDFDPVYRKKDFR